MISCCAFHYQPTTGTLAIDGFEQVKELFGYAEGVGETSQSVSVPSINYLREAMMSGMLGTPLPAYSES